jgi:glutathione S-transferase
VTSVLDTVLAEKEYLVGNKVTIADISFVPWNFALRSLLPEDSELSKELPKYKHFARWNEALQNHPAVKKTVALRNEAAGL